MCGIFYLYTMSLKEFKFSFEEFAGDKDLDPNDLDY